MNKTAGAGLISGVLILGSPVAYAELCNARFTFDGNLADAGGAGISGQMIGKDNAIATPQFVDGKNGQALKLDGNSAMRAFVDLNYESCPQVTIAAWVRFDGDLPKNTQSIISTGAGAGPGLRASGSALTLTGTDNGLSQRNAVRRNAGWMFVAGVYDYEKGTQQLYYRTRSVERKLGKNLRMPEDALWIGSFNDQFSSAASDISIDELQIFGRALNPQEIGQLRKARGNNICFPDVCKSPTEISAGARSPMPLVGADFVRSGAISPDPAGTRAMPAVGADFARSGAIAGPNVEAPGKPAVQETPTEKVPPQIEMNTIEIDGIRVIDENQALPNN